MKTKNIKTNYPNTISMSQDTADIVRAGKLKFGTVYSIATGKSLGNANMRLVKSTLKNVFEKDTGRRYSVARFK